MKAIISLISLLGLTSNLCLAQTQVPVKWEARTALVQHVRGYNFYSCKQMETILRDDLEALGAKNIDTQCDSEHSGLNHFAVLARFSTAIPVNSGGGVVDAAVYQIVNMHGNSGCETNRSLFQQIIPYFTVTAISDDNCSANSSYNFQVEILK